MKTLRGVITLLFVLLFLGSNAQLKTKVFTNEIPKNLLPLKDSIRRIINITPPVNFNKLKTDAERNDSSGGINRFAIFIPVDIDLLKEATTIIKEDQIIYALTLKVPSSLSISLQFKQFVLSKNSILSVFTKYDLTDSITAKQNSRGNVWRTRTYEGELVHFVLKVPSNERSLSVLQIGGLYLGFKQIGITPLSGHPGASASCIKRVGCIPGWEKEKNAVARIDAHEATGTGTLVMNTCNTNIPYILTAQHGLDGHESNWSFVFKYYSTDCNSNVGYSEDIQFSGATVRAAYANSDFALLQLNETPSKTSGLYYAGWDKNLTSSGNTSVTMLHHPKADLMKISIDNDPPEFLTWYGKEMWKVNWNDGGQQGGSSGGPFFNTNHRIIGFMSYVETIHKDEPCYPIAYGGRFNTSWSGGGTNSTRLSNWLDPNNTGAWTTNTTSIGNLISLNPNDYQIAGAGFFCGNTSNSYTVSPLPAGATVTWEASPAGIVTINSPNATNTTITKITNGVFSLTATITICGSTPFTVTRGPIYAGDKGISYINLSWLTPCIGGNSQLVQLDADPSIMGTNWHWSVNVGSQFVFTSSTTTPSVQGYVTGSYAILLLNYTGAFCNTPLTGSVTAYTTCNYALVVSPNPANNIINVSLSNLSSDNTLGISGSGATITKIEIRNQAGTLIKEYKFAFSPDKRTLDISALKQGLYFIRAFDGSQWHSVSFMKK